MNEKIRVFLILLIVIAIQLQISPFGLEGDRYTYFKYLISSLIFVCFVFSIKSISASLMKSSFLKKILIALLVLSVLSVVINAFSDNFTYRYLSDIYMSFLILIVSYSLPLSDKNFKLILNVFLFFSIFLSLYTVFHYAKGFVIYELYLPVPKNQIGPIYATSILTSFFLFNIEKRQYVKALYLVATISVFVCLLILRSRASIVSVILSVILYYVFYRRNVKIVLLVSIALASLLLLTSLGSMIYDSLFLNYDASDLNSLSANRTDDYILGLDYVLDHPFAGELFNEPFAGGKIHNYILDKLVMFGTLYSIGYLFVYFLFLYKLYEYSIVSTENNLNAVGAFILLVPFVVSLFEFSYPFSPGTAVFIAYFCFAQKLRNTNS